jgi:hypothetical protein
MATAAKSAGWIGEPAASAQHDASEERQQLGAVYRYLLERRKKGWQQQRIQSRKLLLLALRKMVYRHKIGCTHKERAEHIAPLFSLKR